FVHALWRTASRDGGIAPAWYEQSWIVAALGIVAVISNWVTTGDHLLDTIARGYWPVAGVDLGVLTASLIAALVARRLMRRAASRSQLPASGEMSHAASTTRA